MVRASPTGAPRRSRFARLSLRGVAGLLALMVLLALAWAACNNRWVDERARPVPAVLKLAPATVPEERNSFFAFEVLDVPAATNPQPDGLRLWRAMAADDVSSLPLAGADQLAWMEAPPRAVRAAWDCDARLDDCVAVWWGQALGLAAHLDESALGLRCEGQVQPGMLYEEPLPTPRLLQRTRDDSDAAPLMGGNLRAQCLRWLQVHAVVAASEGQVDTMLRYLGQADALTQALLTGSRTLTSQLAAATMAKRHWRVVTGLASRYPGLAGQLAALVHPLPEAARSPAEWMRNESASERAEMQALATAPCTGAADAEFSEAGSVGCTFQWFLLPNAANRRFDEIWSRAVQAATAGGVLALMDWRPAAKADTRGLPFVWRNTVGEAMINASLPDFPVYVRRQANLVLQNEAARLALRARDVPVAAQGDWLRQQPIDDRLRDRLTIDNGQIVARGWMTGRSDDTMRFPIPSGVTIATSRADTATAPTAQARAEPAQAGT